MLVSYFISVFIHILSAVVWLGALMIGVFSWSKLHGEPDSNAGHINNGDRMLSTYRWITWGCFFSLFVTGLYNLFVRGYNWFDLMGAEFWQGYFGETLMIKLLLFCGILVSSLINDFNIRKMLIPKSVHTSAEFTQLKKKSRCLLNINMVLGIGILLCAIMLVRGRPW